jgi:uncharacterized membrane protein HdeD (DUF308 family)
MIIGSFFILSGIYSFILHLRNKERKAVSIVFPVVATGSVLLGIWLVVIPDFFVRIFMYLWGGLLVIAGVQQLLALFLVRKQVVVPYGYYVLPSLILLAGVVILIQPVAMAANTLIIIGIVSWFYGIGELINWYKFRPAKTVKPDESNGEEETIPETDT